MFHNCFGKKQKIFCRRLFRLYLSQRWLFGSCKALIFISTWLRIPWTAYLRRYRDCLHRYSNRSVSAIGEFARLRYFDSEAGSGSQSANCFCQSGIESKTGIPADSDLCTSDTAVQCHSPCCPPRERTRQHPQPDGKDHKDCGANQ